MVLVPLIVSRKLLYIGERLTDSILFSWRELATYTRCINRRHIVTKSVYCILLSTEDPTQELLQWNNYNWVSNIKKMIQWICNGLGEKRNVTIFLRVFFWIKLVKDKNFIFLVTLLSTTYHDWIFCPEFPIIHSACLPNLAYFIVFNINALGNMQSSLKHNENNSSCKIIREGVTERILK